MTSRIVKIEPADNWFTITWELGNRCNQQCCYCPPMWHNPSGKIYSLEELQQHWINIFNETSHLKLKYKISFTGGEVTIQKNFRPFVAWLRENYGEHMGLLLVTSNGTAGLNYYLDLFTLIDNLAISLHSEYIDEQKFFSKIIAIKENLPRGKHFHVNVMNEPWNADRIAYYEQILNDNNIYYSVNSVFVANEVKPVFIGKLNLDLSKSYKLQL